METGLLSAITKERAGGPWQEELTAILQEAEGYRFLRVICEEGEAEEMARRYPLYLKKRVAAASDFGGTALTILRLQADGLSLNQIAKKLDMKPFSVSYHIQENYRKLNVDRKADALLAARGLGLL